MPWWPLYYLPAHQTYNPPVLKNRLPPFHKKTHLPISRHCPLAAVMERPALCLIRAGEKWGLLCWDPCKEQLPLQEQWKAPSSWHRKLGMWSPIRTQAAILEPPGKSPSRIEQTLRKWSQGRAVGKQGPGHMVWALNQVLPGASYNHEALNQVPPLLSYSHEGSLIFSNWSHWKSDFLILDSKSAFTWEWSLLKAQLKHGRSGQGQTKEPGIMLRSLHP